MNEKFFKEEFAKIHTELAEVKEEIAKNRLAIKENRKIIEGTREEVGSNRVAIEELWLQVSFNTALLKEHNRSIHDGIKVFTDWIGQDYVTRTELKKFARVNNLVFSYK